MLRHRVDCVVANVADDNSALPTGLDVDDICSCRGDGDEVHPRSALERLAAYRDLVGDDNVRLRDAAGDLSWKRPLIDGQIVGKCEGLEDDFVGERLAIEKDNPAYRSVITRRHFSNSH